MFIYSLVNNIKAGNIFINNALSGGLEIISFLITPVLMERKSIGRNRCLRGTLLISGLSCIIALILNLLSVDPLIVTMIALIGKTAIAGTFGVIFNYTAELYPTQIRATGFGFCSAMGRIGSIAAPLVIGDNLPPWTGNLVFGCVSITAGKIFMYWVQTLNYCLAFVANLLPETYGTPLPQTITDIEETPVGF